MAFLVVGGILAFVLVCGVGITAVGAIVGPPTEPPRRAAAASATPTALQASASAPATPSATPLAPTSTPSAPAQPVVEKRTVTETQRLPFAEKTVKDSSLAEGVRKVRAKGVAGVKTLVYEVTLTDGVETGRKLVRQEVTKNPVTQVVAVGTKKTKRCDPNYSGACVPIASDVDCAGGSGNGPAYVQGPVRVVGSDIYDLDRDGDGIGCDD
ncbi:G5 domain-containing protein [Micromonospora sp. NPDC049559]|uniref:G5 domain-containing protein n=1 Tax=Micromonospora sp. NPDC049559 TaxID=3155923 RepID=UPI00341B25AA